MDANSSHYYSSDRRSIEEHLFSDEEEKCDRHFSSWLKKRPEDTEYIVVKFVPKGEKAKFEQSVFINYPNSRNAKELSKRCGYNCLKTFTRHFKKFLMIIRIYT